MNIFRRGINFLGRTTSSFLYKAILLMPYFRFVKETRYTQVPITLKTWFIQKVLGFNKDAYWPVHHSSKVNQYKNIVIGVETSPGYEPGCYIQGIGKVFIGDYTQIAQNVGIISANHDVYDSNEYVKKSVRIGSYCWIGMNAVILPGVELGDFTIVGAGSVVTKSYPEGHCIIGGNPAKIIKHLEKDKCIPHKSDMEYNGYIKSDKFDVFRKKKLWA